MYEPEPDDEVSGLVGYVDQQLDAIRAAAIGLTEEQLRARPCRSDLSIGGLIKHATYVMRGATERLVGQTPPADLDDTAVAAYRASFALTDEETGATTLAGFDATRPGYLAVMAGTDPGAATVEPPAPWHGIHDSRPARARYYLVHQIEELARHAGHADIIREQIDGMAVPAIVLSESGASANDFFQPYAAPPGTIGARSNGWPNGAGPLGAQVAEE